MERWINATDPFDSFTSHYSLDPTCSSSSSSSSSFSSSSLEYLATLALPSLLLSPSLWFPLPLPQTSPWLVPLSLPKLLRGFSSPSSSFWPQLSSPRLPQTLLLPQLPSHSSVIPLISDPLFLLLLLKHLVALISPLPPSVTFPEPQLSPLPGQNHSPFSSNILLHALWVESKSG
ncbi:hypothetical protein E2C01_058292 [Portunus trituberculatus]|uniref:Uncharacterized protein n=1 Tax=Portunus trituberculatus TaxID=210409 RepID=A0A5B7GV81_PORTR|nr:hypothetical protein [Portunus trituberculatus]